MFALCITTYNRLDMLIESFEQALDDPRIAEIVISDDCSDPAMYDMICAYCKKFPKIRLYRNDRNVGMSMNKKLAVERATQEWCILLDSDNRITKAYLHALYLSHLYPNIINVPDAGYQEDPGRPRLDYRRFGKWYISRANINYFLGFPRADMLMNTCNYCVNRQRYLDIYEYDENVKGADTIWFNYNWLKAGNAFIVIPGMQYFHRIHAASGYMQDIAHNNAMCDQITGMMKLLQAGKATKIPVS